MTTEDFSEGDPIEVIDDFGPYAVGSRGVVKVVDPGHCHPRIGCEMEDRKTPAHTLDGVCDDGHGWWFPCDNLRIVEEDTSDETENSGGKEMKKEDFHEGDQIEVIEDFGPYEAGARGIVRSIDSRFGHVSVECEMEEYNEYAHSLDDLCENGHGWCFPCNKLRIVEKDQSAVSEVIPAPQEDVCPEPEPEPWCDDILIAFSDVLSALYELRSAMIMLNPDREIPASLQLVEIHLIQVAQELNK